MSRPRYFFLDEACPAKDIESMMCRVVFDKLLPLYKFAPSTPLSPNETPHNTNDIIPDILPSPSLTTNRKDFLETVRDSKLQASLTSFFGLDFGRSRQDRLSLETEQVKRYTLNNPGQYFEALMENKLYAQDVRKLLRSTHFGRAYLVVGFLTTSGATWVQKRTKENTTGGSVTIPISAIAGAPTGLDPTISPGISTSSNQERTMHVAEEEIFAVAYSVVKMSYSFDRKAAGFTKKTPVVGPPKRANARHHAFSRESDDEEDKGSDEDGDGGKSNAQGKQGDITMSQDENILEAMGLEGSFQMDE